jgi:hypothetical protein
MPESATRPTLIRTGFGTATPRLGKSVGMIYDARWQVPHLVLGDVEPNAVVDMFPGAERSSSARPRRWVSQGAPRRDAGSINREKPVTKGRM